MYKKLKKWSVLTARIMIYPLILLAMVLLTLFLLDGNGRTTETYNVARYGTYTGNYDNKTPAKFITSFFPEKIRDDFSGVSYHYKAKKGDSYAFEVWLDFTIEDTTAFNAFIQAVDGEECATVFSYDPSYMDYTVSSNLDLCLDEDHRHSAEMGYPIGWARIGKMLYCKEIHHIIFVAIGVYDGYGVTTKELSHFLDYFHIDPLEFAQNTSK